MAMYHSRLKIPLGASLLLLLVENELLVTVSVMDVMTTFITTDEMVRGCVCEEEREGTKRSMKRMWSMMRI